MQTGSLYSRACTAAGALLLAASAPAAETVDQAADSDAAERVEEVVVAHPLSTDGLSEAATVLSGEKLARETATSIGATVGRQPGIHNADYGAAVGRPVIHGLGGPRVRLMEDRIDAMDASVISADHAVTIEPFLADRVEVIKGPSTLLYGSGAIGGVVDVHTGRVPQRVQEAIAGRFTLLGNDNGNGRAGALRLDGGGGGFAWHLDGFNRSASDYDIPGFAESRAARAAEAHEDHHEDEHGEGHDEDHDDHDEDHDGDHEEEAEAYGRLPGSYADGRGGAAGFSIVGERGFAGISASRLDYEYGLPGHSHAHHDEEEEHDGEAHHEDEHEAEEHDDHDEEHGEEHGEGTVTIEMEQTRVDAEAGVKAPFGPFTSLNARFGVNDYAHVEVEPESGVGTRFAVDSYEGRVELVQDDGIGVDGVLGAQFGRRDFSAIGEEAFVPPVETSNVGLFWVGERVLPTFNVEAGLRVERVAHAPSEHPDASFTAVSGSLGIVTRLDDATLGINGGFSSRAPSAEELYSDGPHLATGSFEIGDPGLDVEAAWHAAATVSWSGERAEATATVYATAFRDYIYQFADGTEMDELRVLRFGQADAFFRGLDLAARVEVASLGDGALALTAQLDTVAARIDVSGNDHVPRLPPTRYGVGLAATHGRWQGSLDYLRVAEQSDTAAFELPTDAYGDLRLHVTRDWDCGAATCTAFFQGRNLRDEEQRNHASFVKDAAPAPGRTLEIGMRVAF